MELLIAITLLSLLSAGMLVAMRVGLNAMTKTNSRVISNRRVLSVERILTQQIAGFIPTKMVCQAGPSTPGPTVPFFQGEPQTMRFVSTYSLNEGARGYPRILEFQVIPGEDGIGVRLIVNEHLYSGLLSTVGFCVGMMHDPTAGGVVRTFRPVQAGPQSFVLADKLASCSFAYRQRRDPPEQDIWRPKWIEEIRPAAVRIDMVPLSRDPAKLHVPSVVAPFHPDRNPMADY
jgi:general secretion pathway protein J